MEYNVDLKSGLDINNENSLTLLLKGISRNSSILEFGPAYGRMTRFLKEELECQVTCVELNPKTERVLKQYAENVIIGNIEDYEWAKQIKGKKFDYIVFADVLEHLVNPEKALRMASSFLTEGGKILLSIPNIAHNAVITNLYFNEFNYQEVGILDETHLRFFTQNSLKKMFSKVGLYIHDQNATFYTPEMTGLINQDLPKNIELESLLRKRSLGYVYQYIYTLGKAPYQGDDLSISIDEMIKPYTFKVYFDVGSGFTENSIYKECFNLLDEQSFQVEIERDKSLVNVRIDPIDVSCVCILKEISVVDSLGGVVHLDINRISSNAIFNLDNTYVFLSNDPQFFIQEIGTEWKKIKICFSLEETHIEEYGFLNKVNHYILNRKNNQKCLLEKNRELHDRVSENLLKTVQNENSLRGQKIAELEGMVRYREKQEQDLWEKLHIIQNECQKLQNENQYLREQLADLSRKIFKKNLRIIEFEDQQMKQ